jgi:primase-polymerase (primpol)-like protein
MTKVPYSATDPDRRASTTNPRTWTGFQRVRLGFDTGGFHGIGFVFSDRDPYVGIDLDHCRDPETRRLE